MAALRSIGIQPDAIVARSDRPINDGLKRKISLMCDVDEEAVVSAPDAPSIYDIPKVLHAEGLDAYVVRRLGLPFRDVDWSEWDDLLRRVHRPAHSVTIALVGKYVDLPDAYLSPAEALKAGGFANDAQVNIRWVISDACEDAEGAAAELDGVDGMLIPGGFGVRGIEGKIGAIRYAREHGIPILGLCLGLQCMVIEVARDLAGLADADSAEFNPHTPYPVISTMADQEDVVAGERDMGGTMRLGLYPAVLQAGTRVEELYGSALVEERHRHRYEVNNAYRAALEEAGLVFSGLSPDGHLVEFAEMRRPPVLRRHPGASGIPVPPDPAASAVQGPDRGRPRALQVGRAPWPPAPRPPHEQHRQRIRRHPRALARSRLGRAASHPPDRRADRPGPHPRPSSGRTGRGASSGCRSRARPGRRGPGIDDQAVPASGRQPAVGDPGGPAGRPRGGAAGHRAPAS